ncbi:MAG TPA: sulfatase-like hydrolase/transferase, partial [Acidimicrobiales bacterium]|nr:sulfatase-like hydrolase/transferase [Acidimicrobiales bacterium]
TPLADRFDNVARAARRAGFNPTLFGYTDTGIDPVLADGPDDPRLDVYDEVLPGFSVGLRLPENQAPYLAYLESLGYDVRGRWLEVLASEPSRPAEHSHSAFLTDAYLRWLERQGPGWFAHLSYLRPHSPYAAAGEYSRRYREEDMSLPIPAGDELHALHRAALGNKLVAAPTAERELRALRAQYLGMVSEVDHQLGRVLEAIRARGEWDDTVVVVTSDHGEQLGDHGLLEKLAFFEESYHVPLIIRDPARSVAHGTHVERFTENVDVLPTLCELVGLEVPAQCDGSSLVGFLEGSVPEGWRDAAHWEWDWRYLFLRPGPLQHAEDLQRQNLAVLRTTSHAYVHFGDGSWKCFDLSADPTWRTEATDPQVVAGLAQALCTWRQVHLDAGYPSMLLSAERLGRWPEALARR